MSILPASQTKHLPILHHPIPRNPTVKLALIQITSTSSSNGSTTSRDTNTGTGTTGTTLWSSSQVLSAYLSSLPTVTSPSSSRRALELGAGVGYLSLCLASWGWDVTATDIEPVLSTVLAPNMDTNLPKLHTGSIVVMQVDWTKPLPNGLLENEYDLIITADTIYHPPLTLPLFETMRKICERQTVQPTIYLGLERRDSKLVDGALAIGREAGFEVSRIGRGRVQKALDRAGWSKEKKTLRSDTVVEGFQSDSEELLEDDEGWFDGVEIWKARWKGRSI